MLQLTMKPLIFLIFLGIHGATAVTHSVQYFYTASSGVSNFPEFVIAGIVDGVQINYCDSNIRRFVPKQHWMENVIAEDPQYLGRNTERCMATQQTFKANVEIVKQRFNQTGGVHIFQEMYGCEWDDETGEVKGYKQIAYDGEDFIALDLKTKTWTAPKQQAVITKQRWDKDRVYTDHRINYLTEICPGWVKKYVNYGKSSLMRTELPSVSVLQKPSSSKFRCHATGFYPNRAELFWRKDGEEVHEGVDKGEILPNNDGTFQMSANLKLSPSEDQTKYECVFQLSGVEEDIITKIEKPGFPLGIVLGAVAGLLLLIVSVVGVCYWRKRSDGFQKASSSDTSSNPSEDPDPNKGSSEQQKMMGGARC